MREFKEAYPDLSDEAAASLAAAAAAINLSYHMSNLTSSLRQAEAKPSS